MSSVDASPTVDWQVVAGQVRLIVGGNGQVASYVAPDAGSGQATIRATLKGSGGAGSEPASDQVTLNYGTCGSFGDGVAACSSAEAFSGVWVRYALPVERATSFVVDLNLACGDNVTAPVPTTLIQLFFTRVDANGAPVPNHRDPAQFIQPVRQVSCAAASDPITFAVDEPASPGTTDTMTVMIATGTGIGTTTEPGAGQQQLNASLTGTVQVREAR